MSGIPTSPIAFASLTPYSTFGYGEKDAMQSFFSMHAVKHAEYAPYIASTYKVDTPIFDLFDNSMVADVQQMMAKKPQDRNNPMTLQQWLQLHNNLHVVEMQALNIQSGFDLVDADFTDPTNFYDWMQYHAYLHDIQDSVLGAAA